MEVSGEQHFNAPRDVVWEMLLDPRALRAAMPGCEKFQEVGPQTYDLTIRIGLSAIKGTYSGRVKVADAVAPTSYRLIVSGSGLPGGVQGDATMTLTDDGAGTLVRCVGHVKAHGVIARLGSPLLSGTARLMIAQFFKAMERQVGDRVA